MQSQYKLLEKLQKSFRLEQKLTRSLSYHSKLGYRTLPSLPYSSPLLPYLRAAILRCSAGKGFRLSRIRVVLKINNYLTIFISSSPSNPFLLDVSWHCPRYSLIFFAKTFFTRASCSVLHSMGIVIRRADSIGCLGMNQLAKPRVSWTANKLTVGVFFARDLDVIADKRKKHAQHTQIRTD